MTNKILNSIVIFQRQSLCIFDLNNCAKLNEIVNVDLKYEYNKLYRILNYSVGGGGGGGGGVDDSNETSNTDGHPGLPPQKPLEEISEDPSSDEA